MNALPVEVTESLMAQHPEMVIGVKTRYMLFNVNPITGKETQLTGWSENTLLTTGRNSLALQANWVNAIHLGTDATDPNAGQTGLIGFVAATTLLSTAYPTTSGAAAVPPYYGWKRIRFRFTPGQAVGNLNEVGLGWTTTPGDIAFRALLVDINGIQTTVVPFIDEYVDVVAEIRYYPPLDDVTGTVDFDGITYNYIIRAAEVTSGTHWGSNIGVAIGHHDLFTSYWQAYDGDLGTIAQAPSGVAYAADGTNAYDLAYSNNSYERQMAQIGGPAAWNALGGKKLRSFRFVTKAGAFQVQFDSQSVPGFGIPKNDNYNIKFSFVISWAEAGPIFTGTIPTQNYTDGVPASLDISAYFQPNLPEPILYTVLTGTIPAGMSLNSSTGLLDGTPNTVSSGSLEIQCENDVGASTTNVFAWAVV